LDESVGRKLRASSCVRHVALVDYNGVVDVELRKLFERDIFDDAAANVWSSPALDPGSVLSIAHFNIRGSYVLHNVEHARKLAKRADRNTMRAVAIQVGNENVGGIRLERNTVVSVVYNGVFNRDLVAAIDVPSICVRWAMNGSRDGVDIDVLESDILPFVDQVEPLGAVDHLDIFDQDVGRLEYRHSYGTQQRRV